MNFAPHFSAKARQRERERDVAWNPIAMEVIENRRLYNVDGNVSGIGGERPNSRLFAVTFNHHPLMVELEISIQSINVECASRMTDCNRSLRLHRWMKAAALLESRQTASGVYSHDAKRSATDPFVIVFSLVC